MKCQILFSGKNKKNIINLSSAENSQRVVKVNDCTKQKGSFYHMRMTISEDNLGQPTHHQSYQTLSNVKNRS